MSGPVNDKDVAEQIAKLYELHKSGALTESEFENAKQRVLGGKPPLLIAKPPPVRQNEHQRPKERSAFYHMARGCMIFVIGFVALVITGAIATAIFGDGGSSDEDIPLSLTLDVNTGMIENWAFGGEGCDHPDYTFTVSSSSRAASGRIAEIPLSGGTIADNVFCRYEIAIDAPRHDAYWVGITTSGADVTVLSKTVNVPEDAESVTEELRWYHPRDN